MQIHDEAAQRLGSSLEALNARIARLAIGLGVSLDDRASVEQLMHQPQVSQVPQERGVARQSSAPAGSGERRVSHQREELRGLLVLRYQMETDSVKDNGLEVTRQIIEEAEVHMVHQGFKPGADGLGMEEFFKAP